MSHPEPLWHKATGQGAPDRLTLWAMVALVWATRVIPCAVLALWCATLALSWYRP